MALAETAQLAVRISLQDGLTGGVNKALGSVGRLESGLGRAGKGIGQVGAGFVKAGAVIAAAAGTGLAAAAKTAIEFDDAFAGVVKTVSDGTPKSAKELADLNVQLHALATRIPVKYTDLADIAAEAGALGVPTQSVAKFTETVARLSASTQGLTVQAAAEAFGKFRNTLKLSDAELTNAASSLIALGNAGASSEGDIIEVAKRFGAAGHQAGLSAAQVLGFSSAIASLGVEPEAAGSSLSRLFNNITKYIGIGDKKIVAFAKTTGVSVKTFKQMFTKDASGAVQAFLTKLSKLDKFSASKVLHEAGVNNVRDINAVLLLSQNYGELKRQVDLSSKAFKDNTDLSTVSTTRFDTLKNKIIVLKNNLLEAGYNIAEGFLPALGRATDKLTTFLALPETKTALQDLGAKIGKLIDGIDWGKLLEAAKGAVAVLEPMVSALVTVAGILNALPTQVKGAGAALLVGNKLSGGLIGQGAGNIVAGLASSIAGSLAIKLPGGLGAAFVQKVWVVNMPAGGLGGGGLPGGAAAGAGGIGLAGLLGIGAAGALGVAAAEAAKQIGDAASRAIFGNGAAGDASTRVNDLGRGIAFGPFETLRTLPDMISKLADAINGPKTNSPANPGRVQSDHQMELVAKAQADATTAFRASERASQAIATKQDTTNSLLAQVRDRRERAANVYVNTIVNTSVSLSAFQQSARISSRVARSTAIQAS